MALADALGINLVETFLAFLQSDNMQRRRLLDIAGASAMLAEVEHELAHAGGETETPPEEKPDDEATLDRTPAPNAGADDEQAARAPSGPAPVAPPVPL